MFRGWRKYLWIVLVLVILGLGGTLWPYIWDALRDDEVLITISPQTTVIEAPLRPDGYVDYLAAVEAKSSAGATPENNAVVVLWQVWGPQEYDAAYLSKYFAALGIPPVAEKGDYLPVWYREYNPSPKKSDAPSDGGEKVTIPDLGDDLERWATTHPWTDEQIPRGSAWIKENETKIQQLIAGSARPKFYSPLVLVDPDAYIMTMNIPTPELVRKTFRTLCFYAMGCLGQGRTADASTALLAAFRWGRLASQGPGSVSWMVCIAAERQALAGLEALVCSRKLSATEINQLSQQIDELPPLRDMADMLEGDERPLQLAALTYSASTCLDLGVESQRPQTWWDRIHDRRMRRWIQWDPLLVRFNTLFDAELAVVRARNDEERIKTEQVRDILNQELEKQQYQRPNKWDFLNRAGAMRQRAEASLIGVVMIPIPLLSKVAQERNTNVKLQEVTFALALHRAEHGSYPADLAALVPEYLPELPTDAFTDPLPLVYRLEGDEFFLYSYGINRQDDGGKKEPRNGLNQKSNADDHAVRSLGVPAPAREMPEGFVPSEE